MEGSMILVLRRGTGGLRKGTWPNRPDEGAVNRVSGRHPNSQAAIATRKSGAERC